MSLCCVECREEFQYHRQVYIKNVLIIEDSINFVVFADKNKVMALKLNILKLKSDILEIIAATTTKTLIDHKRIDNVGKTVLIK